MAYETREIGKDYVASVAGFLVVRLSANHASDATRVVVATCTVDREVVASGSAADMKDPPGIAPGHLISSTTQTFTVPVHANSTYRVDRTGGGNVEARWIVT